MARFSLSWRWVSVFLASSANVRLCPNQQRLGPPSGADYPGQALRNPTNEANDFGDLLRHTLDFDAEIIRNAGQQIFDNAMRRFTSNSSPGEVGLSYFSGHGKDCPCFGGIRVESESFPTNHRDEKLFGNPRYGPITLVWTKIPGALMVSEHGTG
jgi:hypothetical protein